MLTTSSNTPGCLPRRCARLFFSVYGLHGIEVVIAWNYLRLKTTHRESEKGRRDTLVHMSLLNIDRFSQFFHRRTLLEICNKIINKERSHLTTDVLLHYLVKCSNKRVHRRTAHRACETIKLLQRKTPAFISPDLWPPNSPDRNPVNYKICGVMQDRIYQKKVKDINELRERLFEVWVGLQQNVIDDAIDQWRRRLRACVRARGGHFEYLLWLTALAT